MTASIYQMLRGAEILFSALFAVLFLKRKLNRLHYGGVVCCMVCTLAFANLFLNTNGTCDVLPAFLVLCTTLGSGAVIVLQL